MSRSTAPESVSWCRPVTTAVVVKDQASACDPADVLCCPGPARDRRVSRSDRDHPLGHMATDDGRPAPEAHAAPPTPGRRRLRPGTAAESLRGGAPSFTAADPVVGAPPRETPPGGLWQNCGRGCAPCRNHLAIDDASGHSLALGGGARAGDHRHRSPAAWRMRVRPRDEPRT